MDEGEGNGILKKLLLIGSAEQCIDQLDFSLNFILQQRNVYPDEAFEPKWEHGVTVYQTTHEGLRHYFQRVKHVLLPLVEHRCVKTIDLLIKNAASGVDLERWRFMFTWSASPREIQEMKLRHGSSYDAAYIRSNIRSIAAVMSYLPLIEESASIEVQLETLANSSIPEGCIKIDSSALPQVDKSGTNSNEKEQKYSS